MQIRAVAQDRVMKSADASRPHFGLWIIIAYSIRDWPLRFACGVGLLAAAISPNAKLL
jgi:hypothetical protein